MISISIRGKLGQGAVAVRRRAKSKSHVEILSHVTDSAKIKSDFLRSIISFAWRSKSERMSLIPRLGACFRSRASSSDLFRAISPIPPRSISFVISSTHLAPTRRHRRSSDVKGQSNTLDVRRRYAAATALKEVEEPEEELEEEEEEPVWPVRVLPELSGNDRKRLRRQRNVGMSVRPRSRMSELMESLDPRILIPGRPL